MMPGNKESRSIMYFDFTIKISETFQSILRFERLSLEILLRVSLLQFYCLTYCNFQSTLKSFMQFNIFL